MYVCIYIYTYIYIHTMCEHIYIYIHTCVYIYICIHTRMMHNNVYIAHVHNVRTQMYGYRFRSLGGRLADVRSRLPLESRSCDLIQRVIPPRLILSADVHFGRRPIRCSKGWKGWGDKRAAADSGAHCALDFSLSEVSASLFSAFPLRWSA